MNKIIASIFILCGLTFSATAQFDLNKIKKQASKSIPTSIPTSTNITKSLTNDEIIKGLKEALTVGANNSSTLASKLDGYYKNPDIKIPFPQGTKKMESTLRSVGMGPQVDKAVMTLNRAAEKAAKEAAPIFINAITSMSITDGLSILNGGDNAATNYLKSNTSNELLNKFKPIIQRSLQEVEVTKYWNPLVSKYNKIPMVEKMNPDLDAYVTDKAITGLFFLVGQEESKIRKDPAAQVTDILKKVFGK